MTGFVLVLILNLLAIMMQLGVVYIAWKICKTIKPLKLWTGAWGLFVISMALVLLRRVWSLFEIISIFNYLNTFRYVLELLILILISFLWIVFVTQLRKLFVRYLNGEGVLLEREGLVREKGTSGNVTRGPK